ncbi:MAG TPA: FHA domain-containing protein [Acidimicrobiales bacterium]|nr:FHA domain-containing protein [Acidimicrobiales bacterium]
MSDSLLNLLKLLLLALVYLFFVRVLRAMWVQVTAPVVAPSASGATDATVRAGAPPVARLRILEPADQKGKTFDLTDEVTVGRASGCQVALTDATVSQLHARIFRRDGKLYVEDLGSSNGTFVNRKKVAAPVAIRRGDRLALGATVLEVMR